ncbi:MAG: TIGR04283 family arsenosugar biosynthesis glycosyltransferase [Magnetococcales bacterium]|nr:TIGR04283 family arsenosugar biosynthesis glycosyltransferase [Magnetococcales bacterium]
MSSPQLSIIIPVLNEVANLPALLEQIQKQTGCTLEVIVADGGSNDEAPAIAGSLGAICIASQPGRGVQMNSGAKIAKAGLLLFLHADSTLTTPTLLIDAINCWNKNAQILAHGLIAGHFTLQFNQQPENRQGVFRFYEAKTALNRPQCTNGDQGFLISRDFFWQLGGFSQKLPFLEDQILASQIYQLGVWITLPGTLITSARRFKVEGLGRRMILNAIIMAFHHTGFEVFFARAATVYRQQDSSVQLKMTPFFKLINTMHRELGIKEEIAHWRRIGAYVREAAWQLFFLMDLIATNRFNWQKRPFLAFHDRVFRPLTNFLPFDLLTALLTWIWFKLTALYFAIREHNSK